MNTYEKWQEIQEDKAFWEAQKPKRKTSATQRNEKIKRSKTIKKTAHEN